MKNLILLIALFVLGSCADTIDIQECVDNDPYGFWYGLWHGMITPFSFLGSLIWENTSVYAINNTGGWYDFGFLLGIGGLTITSTEVIIKKK